MLNFCSSIIYIFVFIFGAVIGSFLNCVIYRLNNQENFCAGRSFCPHCRHQLKWTDLIPILSFLALKGKCRYCHKRISWQYPVVEFITATLFAVVFWHWGLACPPVGGGFFLALGLGHWGLLSLLHLLLAVCFIIVIFVSDLRYFIIPDKVIFPAIAITFIYSLGYSFLALKDFHFLTNGLLAGFGASAFFLLIILVSKGKWMGVGDVKLAFWMGLLLGWPNILVALFLAFLSGALVGTVLIILRRKSLKSEVPFGPFLSGATFVTIFLGATIANWYLSLF